MGLKRVEQMKKRQHTKTISTLITLLVIFLVILSGPGAAIRATITASDDEVEKGDDISFITQVSVNANERVPIEEFILSINGPTKKVNCTFYTDGTAKSGCAGITIIRLTAISNYTYGNTSLNETVNIEPDFGYGYSLGMGYGYGFGQDYGAETPMLNFTYNITLNTTEYPAASVPYNAQIRAFLNTSSYHATYSSSEAYFNITYTAESNEEIPENETFNVTNSSNTIVIIPGNGLEEIIVPENISETANITLDLSNTFNDDNQSVVSDGLTLLRETTGFDYTVVIPANTTIDGPSSWDGTLILPTVKSIADYVAPDSGTTNVVIEVGTNVRLNFSDPVKIVIGGMSGKSAFWNDGTTTHEITTVCDSATAPTNVPANGECSISSGSDLIIWTYHFSVFGAYTPAAEEEEEEEDNGGSSAVGEPYWTTYYVSEDNFQIGVVKDLKERQRLRVIVDTEFHYVGIVRLTDRTAAINVSSEKQQQAVLAIGQTRKFDVTGDGYYDIFVKLHSISGEKATLTVQSIHEPMLAEIEDAETDEQELEIAACGDGMCAASENCETCATDCRCRADESCSAGVCMASAEPSSELAAGKEKGDDVFLVVILPVLLIILVVFIVASIVYNAEHKHKKK
ncbi:MAG: hypothetical protein V1659_05350 [Candidatus Woesearchaeota archaeon]